MPRFDGTGPMGRGPMTGGGFGPCGGGYAFGRGRNFRAGRGLRRGLGRRLWGNTPVSSPEQDLEMLKREKELLENDIANLEQDIESRKGD